MAMSGSVPLHPADSRLLLAVSLACSVVFHAALLGMMLRLIDKPVTTIRDVFLVADSSPAAPGNPVAVGPALTASRPLAAARPRVAADAKTVRPPAPGREGRGESPASEAPSRSQEVPARTVVSAIEPEAGRATVTPADDASDVSAGGPGDVPTSPAPPPAVARAEVDPAPAKLPAPVTPAMALTDAPVLCNAPLLPKGREAPPPSVSVLSSGARVPPAEPSRAPSPPVTPSEARVARADGGTPGRPGGPCRPPATPPTTPTPGSPPPATVRSDPPAVRQPLVLAPPATPSPPAPTTASSAVVPSPKPERTPPRPPVVANAPVV